MRPIAIATGPDGLPIKHRLMTRPSSVDESRLKCLIAARVEPDSRLVVVDDEGEQHHSPKITEAGMMVPDINEFRVETAA